MRNEIGKQCTGYEHIGKVTSVVCFLIISMWHIYLMIILTDINIYDDDNNDESNIDNDTLRNNDDNDDDENDIYCFSCTETMALDCVR